MTGAAVAAPAAAADPRQCRPISRRQPAAAGLIDDLGGSGRVRAVASRHRTWDQLRQAGGQGRVQRPRLPFPSHEPDTSFGVAIDLDTIEILKETDPDTFWQTPHYVGWEGVLIRYDSDDEERVRERDRTLAGLGRGQAEAASRASASEAVRSATSRSIGRARRDSRHKGIAIAEARGDAAPRLIRPDMSGRARRCLTGC